MRPAGRVAQHQRVRLRAVQQPQADPGKRRMEQRALAFDHIPMAGLVVGTQSLHRPGDEIGDHRVYAHALPRDQNAGLAGGAEAGFDAPCLHCLFQGQGGVHLAAGAIRADGQQTPAGTFPARPHLKFCRGMAHIEELAAQTPGQLRQPWNVGQAFVQAAGDVQARLQSQNQLPGPSGGEMPAPVGDADDQSLRAALHGLRDGQIRQAQIRVTAFQPQLAHAIGRPPMRHAGGGLRGQRVRGIAQKQQIGFVDNHGRSREKSVRPSCASRRGVSTGSAVKSQTPAARRGWRETALGMLSPR